MMHLYILIIGIVLFPRAHTLNCFTCNPDSTTCPQTTCPAQMNQCGALRVITYHGNSKIADVKSRSCLSSQECLKGSMNFGVDRTVISSDCCNSDRCNKNSAPEPPKAKNNGKKCYRCDGNSGCTGTLICDGDEDHCVKAMVTSPEGKNKTVKGCATKSLCMADSTETMPRLSKISCCEGDYCNGADGASVSLLLLATALISNFFFSN